MGVALVVINFSQKSECCISHSFYSKIRLTGCTYITNKIEYFSFKVDVPSGSKVFKKGLGATVIFQLSSAFKSFINKIWRFK